MHHGPAQPLLALFWRFQSWCLRLHFTKHSTLSVRAHIKHPPPPDHHRNHQHVSHVSTDLLGHSKTQSPTSNQKPNSRILHHRQRVRRPRLHHVCFSLWLHPIQQSRVQTNRKTLHSYHKSLRLRSVSPSRTHRITPTRRHQPIRINHLGRLVIGRRRKRKLPTIPPSRKNRLDARRPQQLTRQTRRPLPPSHPRRHRPPRR